MGKANKVSISAMDKIIKDMYVPVSVVEWRGVNVSVKRAIGFKEMLEFVNDVVVSCFDEDGNYMPEIRDFAIKFSLINKYTNIAMPENIEHKYDIIYQTDVIAMIIDNIDSIQFNAILSSIEAKLEHIASANVEMVNRKLDDAISAVEGMQTDLAGLFENVSGDDLVNIIQAVSNGGVFDQDALVKAYIKHTKEE